MSSSSTLHSNLSKTKSKDGNGRYIIQILERLTKVETQVSHLASKEDMANLRTDVANIQTQINHLASKEEMANTRTDMADIRTDIANLKTSFYKGLWVVILSVAGIVGGAEIKTFFFS